MNEYEWNDWTRILKSYGYKQFGLNGSHTHREIGPLVSHSYHAWEKLGFPSIAISSANDKNPYVIGHNSINFLNPTQLKIFLDRCEVAKVLNE